MTRVAALVAAGLVALVAAVPALAAPTAPATPDLVSSSDSGSSPTDNATSDSTPDFDVDVGASQVGMYVTLYVQTGSGAATQASNRTYVDPVADPDGKVTVTAGTGSGYTGALADATYNITAKVDDGDGTTAGTYSNASTALAVQIDNAAPTLARAPTLVDFVGGNSSVTFTPNPRFDVVAATGTVVNLYEGSTLIGTATAVDGLARITVTSSLGDGSHSVYAKGTDAAGNLSGATSSTTITVDSSAAAASTPDLADADDDGSSSTDNYTTNPRPRFTVTTEASARVTLYEEGIALGSAVADSSGLATVQVRESLWLDPGVHCVYAIAMDSLANAGSPSSELCVTIAPGVEPFGTNLGLTIDGADLVAALKSTRNARVKIQVVVGNRVVATANGVVKAGKRAQLKLRLKGVKARRIVVVATFRTAGGKTVVVRRVLVRR